MKIKVLADGFNTMTGEIKRLLEETAEKARMESELNTARVVQSTLFPEQGLKGKNFEVQGFYEPASECGGDWWYYTESKDSVYLWIGDATGHGVPAALVTSAARSASSVLEQFPEMSVKDIISYLNRAIYQTARGQILMTFLLAKFDKKTGQLIYTKASHDPPFLFPRKEELTRDDAVALMGNNSRRLGEKLETEYEETTIQLNQGDRIIFYTDGITEAMNEKQKMWGERRFLKSLTSHFNEQKSLEKTVLGLKQDIDQFCGSEPKHDDVTYFMFEYGSTH